LCLEIWLVLLLAVHMYMHMYMYFIRSRWGETRDER
jgi:hypothetical protein